MAKKKKIKPVEWLEFVSLNPDAIETEDDILKQACELMDDANTSEILGSTLFKADDGKYYCVTIETVIAEANPQWVKEVLAEKG